MAKALTLKDDGVPDELLAKLPFIGVMNYGRGGYILYMPLPEFLGKESSRGIQLAFLFMGASQLRYADQVAANFVLDIIRLAQ